MPLPLSRGDDGVWRSDWAPLLEALAEHRGDPAAGAALFHATLAGMLLSQARAIRGESGVTRLGLSGGVFQNRVLGERVAHLAEQSGFAVELPERLPCNDAGLSFGQIMEASVPE